jgi:hypothetical protein
LDAKGGRAWKRFDTQRHRADVSSENYFLVHLLFQVNEIEVGFPTKLVETHPTTPIMNDQT